MARVARDESLGCSGAPLRGAIHLLPLLVFTASVAWFASASPASRYGFPLDDGWIHRVYARSLAFGHGFAYNAGSQQAGATSPLWILVTAPSHWLEGLGTGAAVVAVKATGTALAALALVLLAGLAHSLSGSRLAGILAGGLLALEPRLAFEGLSGMENALVLVLWLGATWAASAQRPLLGAALLGGLPVARPEALLVLPFGVVGLLLGGGLRLGAGRRLLAGGLVVLPTLLWSLFCVGVSGHWLPTTFYVKSQLAAPHGDALRILLAALGQHGFGGTLAFAPGLAALCVLTLGRRRRFDWLLLLMLLAAPTAYLLGVVATRGVALHGYYWTRWLAPPTLVLTAAACAGLASLLAFPFGALGSPPAGAAPRRRRGPAKLVVAVALVALLPSLPALFASAQERRLRLASDCRAIDVMNVRPGLWIREHVPAGATVGVNDAGALRYFGQRRTLDLVGLNDADVAFGRVTRSELIDRIDWLAAVPAFARDRGWPDRFETRRVFQIPEEEYTVCACPVQTRLVVAEKRKKPALPAPGG